NGGPTCNSCHHVKNDNIIAGGALAKDLTKAYSRLNEAGIKSVLKSPPFPAMQQAYQNKPLTQQEVFNLTAFLQQADKISASQTDRDYGNTLLFSGMGGTLLVFGLFTGLWFRSKRRSVNQSIYRRQIKSK
ncbi:MAG: cytochrome c, partial [candidate division Zixibacteria bacterium]|nr:cytochrome c [Gammaproteobacteria bacterium]NIX59746.1 cytochrome c [candidate division Zixibacteria bacterium]